MTSQKYNRNKREYEDLDEIRSASKDCGQENGVCRFGAQPQKCSSDTAIHVAPEKIRSKKLAEQIAQRSAITGSIPCFFRMGSNLSTVMLDKDSNDQPVTLPKLSRRYTLWLICYIFFYGLYLVSGAYLFQIIETPAEQMVQKNFNDLKIGFSKKYPQIIENDLQDILMAAVSASNAGIRILSTNTTSASGIYWNFGDLVLFTTSMVTTIGYGHISPITNAGKVFCILYACIGIPLTLVLLSTMVEHLFKQSNRFLKVLLKRFGHAYKIFSIQIIHLSILATTFLIIFLLIPAVIFASLESEWSVLDGFYFCFTSLTTIGLGDIVPDINDTNVHGSVYKIMTAIYLVIGLIAIMLVVTVFYTIPQLNIGVWLIDSRPTEVELESSSHDKTRGKCFDKKKIPTIKIESANSSSKTLRTVL